MRDFRHFDKEFAVTNELRTKGTDYLLEAARQAGTRRFIWTPRYPSWRDGFPVWTKEAHNRAA